MNVIHDPHLFAKLVIHRLLAIVLSFSFFACIRLLIGDAFSVMGHGGATFWIFLPLSAVLCIIVCALAEAERVRSAVRIQALCLMLLVFYSIQMLLSGRLYPASFTSFARLFFDCAALAGQWFSILYIEKMFKPRERLLAEIQEWSDQQLYQELRSEGHLLSLLQHNLKRLDALALRGLQVLALILFILFVARRNAGSAALTMVALFAFSVLVVRTLMRLYDRELLYGGQGIKKAFDLSLFSMRIILILSAVLTGSALLLSSNTALLPPTPFQYLLSLITREHRRAVPMPSRPPVESTSTPGPFVDLMDTMGHSEMRTLVNLDLVMRLLGYVLLAVLVLSALTFLFAPLFSSRFRRFLLKGRLHRLIIQFLKALRSVLNAWNRLSNKHYHRPKKSGSRSALATALKDRISRARSTSERRRLGRLAALFMKLIDWGEKQGTEWRVDLAPAEYTDALATVPGIEPGTVAFLNTAGRLFEKALWAADPLTGAEETQFREAVKAVTQIPVVQAEQKPRL